MNVNKKKISSNRLSERYYEDLRYTIAVDLEFALADD